MCISIKGMANKPTTVRFTPEIEARIRTFAAEMGIGINAAISVLVADALAERERRDERSTVRNSEV